MFHAVPASLLVACVAYADSAHYLSEQCDAATQQCSGRDDVQLVQMKTTLSTKTGDFHATGDAKTPEELCYDLDDCGGSCSAWWLSSETEESRKIKCCKCGGGSTHQVVAKSDQDTLSVMTFNTYLLRVKLIVDYDVKPNLDDRAAGISKWFGTLADHEVPDVVVLQEIYSQEGEDLMRKLCSDRWRRNLWKHPHGKHWVCDHPDSKFGHATPSANPTSYFNPVKASGTVVLVKKGNLLLSAQDLAFEDCAGENCMTKRGVWAVEFYKGTQRYWIFGTHTTAWPYESYRESRHAQFKELRKFIDKLTKKDARVAIAGDMNILIAPFVSDHVKKNNFVRYTPQTLDADGILRWNELERMMATLGAPGAPATAGNLVERGFWLPLDVPMNASCDPATNHFVASIPMEVKLGSQLYDWVVAPGPGDRLATPKTMRYQVAPVKADECYVSEQHEAVGPKADDLSDHFAVLAELRFTDSAPALGVVAGHRGTGASFPAGTSCAT